MMVFSNTTPFIALSVINKLDLLPSIFEEIHVADSVIRECSEGGKIMVPDLSSLDWVISHNDLDNTMLPILLELDRGEKQTIALALKEKDSLVIIDEKIGRNIAEYMGLKVVGTLGVLVKAKRLKMIDSFKDEVYCMLEAGIRYHQGLIERIILELGE